MSIIVQDLSEIAPLLQRVRGAATRTAQVLATLITSEPDGLEVLRNMKFTERAWHPLDERALNLVDKSTRLGPVW